MCLGKIKIDGQRKRVRGRTLCQSGAELSESCQDPAPCADLKSAGKKIGVRDETDVASFKMTQSFELDDAPSQKLLAKQHAVIVSGGLL